MTHRARVRASADEDTSCKGTTREYNRCRNPGRYHGLCWMHASKCEFYEISGGISKRCTMRAVDWNLCSKHAHHRFDLQMERDTNAAVVRVQRQIRGHLARKRVTNMAPSNESSNSPGASGEVLPPVNTSVTRSPSKRPCKGKTMVGEDCRAHAVKGTDFCRHHQDQRTGATDVIKVDEKEESIHGGSTPIIESFADTSANRDVSLSNTNALLSIDTISYLLGGRADAERSASSCMSDPGVRPVDSAVTWRNWCRSSCRSMRKRRPAGGGCGVTI